MKFSFHHHFGEHFVPQPPYIRKSKLQKKSHLEKTDLLAQKRWMWREAVWFSSKILTHPEFPPPRKKRWWTIGIIGALFERYAANSIFFGLGFVAFTRPCFFLAVYLRANPASSSKVQQTMKTASSDEELAFKQKVLWMQVGREKKNIVWPGSCLLGFSFLQDSFVFVYCFLLHLSHGCIYRCSFASYLFDASFRQDQWYWVKLNGCNIWFTCSGFWK